MEQSPYVNIDDAFNNLESSNNFDSVDYLLDALDKANDKLSDNWIGEIEFQFKPIMLPTSMIEKDLQMLVLAVQSTEYVIKNICNYINDSLHTRLYFNSQKYHYQTDTIFVKQRPFSSVAYMDLKRDLESAAMNAGSPLVSNGGVTKQKNYQCGCFYRDRLKCEEARLKKDALNLKYRGESLISSDKSNRRVDGRSLRRKTTSSKYNEKKCPFGFTIRWDHCGFYIHLENNTGCNMHIGHCRYDPKGLDIPSRLLSKEEKETLHHLAESCCGSGVSRNYIFSKLGRHISKASIVHFCNKDDMPADASIYSDLDKMIYHFKEANNISFQVLWDIPVQNIGSTRTDGQLLSPVSQEVNTASPFRICSLTRINENEAYDTDLSDSPNVISLKKIAEQARIDENIPNDSNLFLAIAWISKEEIWIFKQFPEVLCVDATSHSTNVKYVLLTFSVRTSVGKQVIILCCWIPNQRRFSFRWVFQEAITSLLPLNHFKRTRLILADGDPQQANKICGAIKHYATNARRGGCHWHIVRQGWKRHCPNESCVPANPPRLRKQFEKLKRLICDWLYSWMRPGYCESKEEYEVSKATLFVFLRSKLVLKTLDNNQRNVDRVITFIRNNVITYDSLFLFYLRKDIRFFDQAVQSQHEGTNYGMKNHAAAMKPSANISTSAKTLMFQSSLKMIQILVKAISKDRRKKNWSSLPTANYVTSLAEGIINQIWSRKDFYTCRRTGLRKFQVFYNDPVDETPVSNQSDNVGSFESITQNTETNTEIDSLFEIRDDFSKTVSPIPQFRRIREVMLNRNGYAKCNCFHFERIGIPCVHILNVFCTLCPDYQGYTHHDISVTWWTSYICNAYLDNSNYTNLFHTLATKDIPGPKLTGNINFQNVPLHSESEKESAWNRIKNFNADKIHELKILSGTCTNDALSQLGLSQSSFDGLTSSTFNPENMRDDENELFGEDIFDEGIEDTSGMSMNQIESREALKGIWTEVLNVHDKLQDQELITKLENLLTSHVTKCRMEIAKRNDKRNKNNIPQKKGTVGILQENHSKSVHWVYASYNC